MNYLKDYLPAALILGAVLIPIWRIVFVKKEIEHQKTIFDKMFCEDDEAD
jgi:hypothetical protein